MIEEFSESEYVGGRMFKDIKIDTRVTPDLTHCLYCKVSTTQAGNLVSDANEIPQILAYRIPLISLSEHISQCPACKKLYILKDSI